MQNTSLSNILNKRKYICILFFNSNSVFVFNHILFHSEIHMRLDMYKLSILSSNTRRKKPQRSFTQKRHMFVDLLKSHNAFKNTIFHKPETEHTVAHTGKRMVRDWEKIWIFRMAWFILMDIKFLNVTVKHHFHNNKLFGSISMKGSSWEYLRVNSSWTSPELLKLLHLHMTNNQSTFRYALCSWW